LYYTASGIITGWESTGPLPTCASVGHLQSVMMPDAVQYNFDLLLMSR